MKANKKNEQPGFMVRIGKDLRMNKYIYLMLLPVIVYLIILNYIPMYGVIIAFKDFKPRLGIMGSPWVGMKYFKEFISSIFLSILSAIFLNLLELYFAGPATLTGTKLADILKYSL